MRGLLAARISGFAAGLRGAAQGLELAPDAHACGGTAGEEADDKQKPGRGQRGVHGSRIRRCCDLCNHVEIATSAFFRFPEWRRGFSRGIPPGRI